MSQYLEVPTSYLLNYRFIFTPHVHARICNYSYRCLDYHFPVFTGQVSLISVAYLFISDWPASAGRTSRREFTSGGTNRTSTTTPRLLPVLCWTTPGSGRTCTTAVSKVRWPTRRGCGRAAVERRRKWCWTFPVPVRRRTVTTMTSTRRHRDEHPLHAASTSLMPSFRQRTLKPRSVDDHHDSIMTNCALVAGGRLLGLHCRFESRPGLLRTKVYSAFHPSGVVGKWVPAIAGKAKAGMAHSDCGCTCGCAGKTVKYLEKTMPYLSAFAVVIHYE